MQVGAADPSVPGDSAVEHLDILSRSVDNPGKRLHRAAEDGLAHVNLVAQQLPGTARRNLIAGREEFGLCLVGLFAGQQQRDDIEESETFAFAARQPLNPVRVGYPPAQHLEAAADTDDAAAEAAEGREKTPAAEEVKVGDGRLAAGKNQNVQQGDLVRIIYVGEADIRFRFQRIEIGIVRNARKASPRRS